MAIEGVQSDTAPGSVLGPLLFVTYINDIASLISEESKINMFADDIALYRIIKSQHDYHSLQNDINAIVSSLHTKHLSLKRRQMLLSIYIQEKDTLITTTCLNC